MPRYFLIFLIAFEIKEVSEDQESIICQLFNLFDA